jgi:hypothetical protein
MGSFFEEFQVCEGFLPQNLATAANDGDWINMEDYEKVVIILFKGVGTAGEDPTLTVLQASSNTGTGSKALNFTTVYKKQAATNLQAVATYTKVVQAAGNTFTHTDLAEQAAIVGIEIDAADLDVNGGFSYVSAGVADVGAASQIGGLLMLGRKARYQGAALPTALA